MNKILVGFLVVLNQVVQGQNIMQYHSVLLLAEPIVSEGPVELAIRSYLQDSQLVYLLVQPDSVFTHTGLAKNYQVTPTQWDFLRLHWADKPYIKALAEAKQNDTPLQNAGINHLSKQDTGITLTADLCPSKLPLDRRVFSTLIQTYGTSRLPVPVSLAVSGLWMTSHHNDLLWLDTLDVKKFLKITWINHTKHHHWDKDLPLFENFLLEQGTDLTSEVLGNEELMLKNGLLPSCLFRFPGLVSAKKIVDRILDWGLIPIGSDAWMAKGQYPHTAGSIVLIHANGNDPIGIEDFLHLLLHKKNAVRNGQWKLLDLREELEKK